MTPTDIDNLIRTLCYLTAAYEPEVEPMDLAKVDGPSYSSGFRAGARSAYADAVCRLREMQAQVSA